MGFVFVDRIIAISADHARGELHWAADGPPVPEWLAIEAVGQLAAWIAIARCEFASRPVAALVGEVQLAHGADRGPLALEARIDRLDGRAVLYSGSARCGTTEVAVLRRCVGPLLPMEAFDDPAAVRQRFERLCAGPATAAGRGASGVPSVTVEPAEILDGTARAQLRVPLAAEFFVDHFPRRPVFPASLLAEAQNRITRPIVARALGTVPEGVGIVRIADFKVRAFSPPGQVLELGAVARPAHEDGAVVDVSAHADGRRIGAGTFTYRALPDRVS